VPFVRLWHHAFKGSGGWYFENSLTTLNQDDPVSELNSALWQQGDKGQAIARIQKRKLKYITNIYIVKDPGQPANEGKVFLFSFGKKIFDKLNEKMAPQFADEVPLNPFDMWEGANFKLRQTKVADFPNYDASVFDAPSPLEKTDAKIEAIWAQAYKLQPFIAADQFKPYAELKERLNKVLSVPTGRPLEASAAQPAIRSAEASQGTVLDVGPEHEAEAVAAGGPKAANMAFFESLAQDE
jgi:hypothetical protein